jgi:hypothetical protein
MSGWDEPSGSNDTSQWTTDINEPEKSFALKQNQETKSSHMALMESNGMAETNGFPPLPQKVREYGTHLIALLPLPPLS